MFSEKVRISREDKPWPGSRGPTDYGFVSGQRATVHKSLTERMTTAAMADKTMVEDGAIVGKATDQSEVGMTVADNSMQPLANSAAPEVTKSAVDGREVDMVYQNRYHAEGSAADWTEMRIMTIGSLRVNPAYQRFLNMTWAQTIADEFNTDLVEVLQVSFRDGQYWIIDGQHTTIGIRIRFKDENYPVVCKIYYGLTVKEEAEMFYLFNKCKKPMNAASMLKAQLFYGDSEVTEFFKLTRDAGFVIDPVKRMSCQYGIAAVSTARNIYRCLGPERYTRMLNLLRSTWQGMRWSLTQKMLSAMSAFLATFEDQLDDQLFIGKLKKVSESELFNEAGKYAAQGAALSLASAMVTFYNKRRRTGKLQHGELLSDRR